MAAVIQSGSAGTFPCLMFLLGALVNAVLVAAPWGIGWLLGGLLNGEQELGCVLLLTASLGHLGAETVARSGRTELRPQIPLDVWYRPLALLSGLALLGTYWLSGTALQWQTPGTAVFTHKRLVVATGFILGGIGLRAAAIWQLDAWFATDLGVPQNQPLVSHGLYRWLRHPSEAGLLLLTAGIGMVGGWRTCFLALTVQGMLTVARIYLEEQALIAAWGERYRAYAWRTAGVCPGVW